MKENGKRGKRTASAGKIWNVQQTNFYRYIWSNGDKYEGEFVDGIRQGRGVLITTDGDRYEGEWRDSQLNGNVKYIKCNGTIYEGQMVNGEKEGQGTIVFENGNRYEGSWKDGNKHGWGRDSYSNGIVWEGENTDGKKQEDIYLSKDQALELDWKDVVDDERIRQRKSRIKKLLANQTGSKKKRRSGRKHVPFQMPPSNNNSNPNSSFFKSNHSGMQIETMILK